MSDLRAAMFPMSENDGVAEGTAENGGTDIVERALAILDEETRAWVTGQQELAEQSEGGSDA